MSEDMSFESECRQKFLDHCALYHLAKFHAIKREHAAKAYEAVDEYLDWRDIQTL